MFSGRTGEGSVGRLDAAGAWLAETLVPVVESTRAKNVALTGRCAPEQPGHLVFDVLRLHQVLSNLISNAVNIVKRGAMSVPVRLRPGSGGVVTPLRVEARGTGCGMAPQDLGRLFQEFALCNEKVFGQYGGTGQGPGLALCERLAERISGRIGVSSALEAGRVLWFEPDLAEVSVEA